MIDVFTDEWVLIDGVLYTNPNPVKYEPPPPPELDFDADCPHWRFLDDREMEEELHKDQDKRGVDI